MLDFTKHGKAREDFFMAYETPPKRKGRRSATETEKSRQRFDLMAAGESRKQARVKSRGSITTQGEQRGWRNEGAGQRLAGHRGHTPDRPIDRLRAGNKVKERTNRTADK
ncbi:hypothetical protein llap_13607 [Limosa lapponica baueri]|uniref:Uncharacterized protein n=1 Tax=Limosa lapponica baueri TaxID=1758121 RepID=A0A2I0TQK9_LIMLA|nr:hypothetical protein llap_13607 [Limosa lapponica baueri]